MAYTDIFDAANNQAFQGRCQVAMWKAAQDIAAEAVGTVNHPARMDWATRVLHDRANVTPRQLAMQVLRNATIAAAPLLATDDDIQFQVNSTVDSLIAVG